MLNYYLELLGYKNIPEFLKKYLECNSLNRLKKVGYFCGMDYASKDIYSFSEYISRYDHSLSVALLTYKLTGDKLSTIAALFHDISTPCFSHVIDYMNKDYETQESTEEYTEKILEKDDYLKLCLEIDGISIDDIDFKKYSIVDNKRPKICTDRLDGIILTSIGWTKIITKEDIKNILENIKVGLDEEGNKEIGFKSKEVAKRVIYLNDIIDEFCHSKEDTYMMLLLSDITKIAIERNYITYDDLYIYNEEELFNVLKKINDCDIDDYLEKFYSILKKDVPEITINNLKKRIIKPLVNNRRYGE